LRGGDRLVVSELSRLGRSLGQVIHIVEELVRRKIRFVAIKEAIRFEGSGGSLAMYSFRVLAGVS
jgi:DNA invertase Pin-like site-specific DNA recombinase